MPDLWMDVDIALAEVPVNVLPLIDDTDFKTREVSVTYNQAGMDLVWNFTTTAGAFSQTAVTPASVGNYLWTNQGDGMYTIQIPAIGGATINNDTEGFGWFTGYATGILPWRGPTIGFRAAGLNNAIVDNAWSATRGLAGTALPDAAANAAGGLPISTAGGLNLDSQIGTDIDTILTRTDVATSSRSSHAAADIWSVATRLLTAGTNIVLAKGVGVTGFNDLDAAGIRGAVGLASANLDTQLGALPTAAENADAVWDEARSGHVGAGSFGQGVASVQGNVTGSVASVTGAVASVTGAVGSVTAGVTVTTNNDKTGYALSSAGVQAIWDALTSALVTAGSIGKLLVDNINATISSRSSHAAADIWSVATRLLTAGTNIVLAKGVGVTGFNDLDAAGIRGAVGLASANLDTQLGALPTAAENADAVWDEARSGHVGAGSFGQGVASVQGNVTGSVASVTAGVTVATNSDKTGYTITSAEHNNVADALLKRDLSTLTGEAARSPLNALRVLRNKVSLSGTAMTVTKEDDATTAWTATVTKDASAEPITAVDPA